MDNLTRARIIKNIQNTIMFKEALIRLTTEEIAEMQKEINKLKEEAEFDPQTASTREMVDHFAAESTNIP